MLLSTPFMIFRDDTKPVFIDEPFCEKFSQLCASVSIHASKYLSPVLKGFNELSRQHRRPINYEQNFMKP